MRQLFTCLISLGLFHASIHAQNTAKLEDEGIYNSQILIQVPSDLGLKFIVKEKYSGSLSENPILFLETNFDIKAYINYYKRKEYHGYKVNLKSNKIHFLAEFDRHGKLLYTFRRIENKTLPYSVQKEIVENFKDWRVIKNSYIASGKLDRIDDEVYSIKIIKGKESKIVRIIPDRNSAKALVNN